MLHEAIRNDEAGRLSALARLELMDSEPEPQFETLTRLVGTVLDSPVVLISLIDDRRQWYKASLGVDFCELPRETSLCNHVVLSGEIVLIEDARNDPRFRDHPLVAGPLGVRAYLGVPLRTADGYTIGTICVVDMRPRKRSEREIEILAQFAQLALEMAELRQIASRDPLTGAWTRRAFADAAAGELARVARGERPASLALFDLDHFKRINDTYGHAAGDDVLRRVGEICFAELRSEDVFGRLGGEEFAVLFVGAGAPAAAKAAERLRRAIEDGVVGKRPDIAFTASFGVAGLAGGPPSFEAWLERADAALYEAKRGGRNRCVTALSGEVL